MTIYHDATTQELKLLSLMHDLMDSCDATYLSIITGNADYSAKGELSVANRVNVETQEDIKDFINE